MKVVAYLFAGLVTVGCSGGAEGGDGIDELPKPGEMSGDPTIVSASAGCELTHSELVILIAGSDPMGVDNLGTCAATRDDAMFNGSFDGDTCAVYLGTPCAAGDTYLVELTVSNETGGVTTATVEVTAN